MLSYGFGDPITGFTNPHNETRRDTSHLSVGHTPSSFGGSSSRGAFAFAPGGHRVMTSTTHLGTVGGRPLFLYLFFFCLRRTGTSSTGSSTATCSATTTAPSSTWGSGWTWVRRAGGRTTHRRSSSSIFVDGGHCIGVRDVANPSTSSPLLSIFIEQSQPSP